MNTKLIETLNLLISNPPEFISIDIETDGLSIDAEIFSVAFAWQSDGMIFSEGFIIDRFSKSYKVAVDIELQKFFRDTVFNSKFPSTIIFHNMLFDLPALIERFKPKGEPYHRMLVKDFCKIHDTQVLSRVLRNNKFVSHVDPKMEKCNSLKYLAREFLNINHHSFFSSMGHKPLRFVSPDDVIKYNKIDVELTLALYKKFETLCTEKEWSYFEYYEMLFNLIILRLNCMGLPFRMKAAQDLSKKIYAALEKTKATIYESVGFSFNLSSSRDLARAIFNNSNLTVSTANVSKNIRPLYLTEKQQVKVDLETLVKIKSEMIKKSPDSISTIKTIANILLALELLQAYEDIEKLVKHAKKAADGTYRIYPKVTVDAKTGRVRSGEPNILGLPKSIFNNSKAPDCWGKNDLFSVRNLVGFEPGTEYEIVSIDISGLDLGVISAGLLEFNPMTFWASCFKKHGSQNFYLDTHMAILSRVNPTEFNKVMQPIGSALKISESDKTDLLISKKMADPSGDKQASFFNIFDQLNNKSYYLPLKNLHKESLANLATIRAKMKTLNLAIPYNLGALSLAKQLSGATGEIVGEFEAKSNLDRYHEEFPEIRKFQDCLAESVYRHGFSVTKFGRKIYADCFDRLNEAFRSSDTYEFIVCIKGVYKLVEVSGWIKHPEPIFSGLRIKSDRCVLEFKNVIRVIDLPENSFRKKKNPSHSKLSRKSEQRQNDQLNFEANLFEITHDIDRQKKFQNTADIGSEEFLNALRKEHSFVIPEASVLFYRVRLDSPSSEFFLPYKSLLKVVRPFFATFCQSEATIIAKICAIQIVERLESKNISADLLLFIHDQFDLICRKQDLNKVKKELVDAIESPKLLNLNAKDIYPTLFSGEFTSKENCFS